MTPNTLGSTKPRKNCSRWRPPSSASCFGYLFLKVRTRHRRIDEISSRPTLPRPAKLRNSAPSTRRPVPEGDAAAANPSRPEPVPLLWRRGILLADDAASRGPPVAPLDRRCHSGVCRDPRRSRPPTAPTSEPTDLVPIAVEVVRPPGAEQTYACGDKSVQPIDDRMGWERPLREVVLLAVRLR